MHHRAVVPLGLAEVPQGGRLVLGFEERRASARLEIKAHPLGLRLLLLEHPRYVLARPVAGLLYLDQARVSLLFGPLYLHQERVGALFAGQLPLPLVVQDLERGWVLPGAWPGRSTRSSASTFGRRPPRRYKKAEC